MKNNKRHRNRMILRQRLRYEWTYVKIGKIHGISPTRARYIVCSNLGVPGYGEITTLGVEESGPPWTTGPLKERGWEYPR